eukprot:1149316-Pelagomonas_calceolata.AAC.1
MGSGANQKIEYTLKASSPRPLEEEGAVHSSAWICRPLCTMEATPISSKLLCGLVYVPGTAVLVRAWSLYHGVSKEVMRFNVMSVPQSKHATCSKCGEARHVVH